MNVNETKRTIMWLPPRQSILLVGPHGIGKSQVVKQSASELSLLRDKNHEFIDIRLSQREVGDIIGMPRRADAYDVTKLVFIKGQESPIKETVRNVSLNDLPVWFPQDPDSAWIRHRVGKIQEVLVLRRRRGWYYKDEKFAGADIDAIHALAMVDDELLAAGYILV